MFGKKKRGYFGKIAKDIHDSLKKVGFSKENVQFVISNPFDGMNFEPGTNKVSWNRGLSLVETLDSLEMPERD